MLKILKLMPKINEEVLKILEEKEKEAEHLEEVENPDFKEYDEIEIDEANIKHWVFDYEKYIKVDEVIQHYAGQGFNKMILITDNGTGKTYNATRWVLEGVLKGINGS